MTRTIKHQYRYWYQCLCLECFTEAFVDDNIFYKKSLNADIPDEELKALGIEILWKKLKDKNTVNKTFIKTNFTRLHFSAFLVK